jgi:hypothetical protein
MLDSQNSNSSWEMEAGRCDHCALCPIWRWMTFAVLSPDISVCPRVLDFSQSTISCRILFSQVPSFHMVSRFWRGQLQTVWEGCASLCWGYMYVDRIWYIWTHSMPMRFAAFCWTLLYDDRKQEDVNFACGIQYLSTLDIVASVACNFPSNSSS